MKILIINWQDITNPLAGGAEVHLHEVFERLANRGHSVTLFCHRYRGAQQIENRNGIKIIRSGNRFLFNYTVFFYYIFKFRKENFDIIVDDVNKIPFYTPLYVHRPIQGVTHHLFGKSIFLETFFPIALYVYLMEKLIKPIYRNVHFIIGSPSTHQEYIAWGFSPEQVTIVNYCVNHQLYYPDPENLFDLNLIGYFGRLKKYKCVDHLLKAMTYLQEEFPELRLKIIGDGDDKNRLMLLSKELGIQDRVEFTGYVEESQKALLLQKMNFVVNTSSKEGWGLTVVETNACGAPVIAANVQGLRDSVIQDKTGLLYEFGNISDLKDNIRTLLLNRSKRDELRKNAIEWAKSFDWEVAATRTIELMEKSITRYYGKKKNPPKM